MGKPLSHTPRTIVPQQPALPRHPCQRFFLCEESSGREEKLKKPVDCFEARSCALVPQLAEVLGPSCVKCGMEEVEDTPIFQERVTYLEGQSKAIKAEVKLLIGQAHAFAHAGVQYAEAGKAFAAKADELGAVMPALQSVGAGLKELFKLVEIMSQKQNELTQPLEQLCAQIKQVYLVLGRTYALRRGSDLYVPITIPAGETDALGHGQGRRGLLFLPHKEPRTTFRRRACIAARNGSRVHEATGALRPSASRVPRAFV